MVLTNQQIEDFHQNGLVVIPNFYQMLTINNVRKELWEMIDFAAKQKGIRFDRAEFEPDNFDAGFNQLLAMNREIGSLVYDAAKHLLSFHRLLCEEKHETVMRQLRPDSHPAVASGGYGIRIDNPGEDKYRAYWHQEYPSQLRSINGLVFWSPLVQMTEDLGPVLFCLESHKLGVCKVSFDEDDSRSGAYKVRLVDEQQLIAKFEVVAPLLSPSDVVVVDYLTLHASGKNRSARSRWSMQFRYFDFADPIGNSIGWKGSFASGIDFATVHPEFTN